ncbi:MAG: terminase large subunit [Lachnospiraceae bacterium]|nr:terminase large subunit [Lachnospiraceae bacterium]
MVNEEKAYKYAQWCVSETEGKAPKYVKLQAQRWIDIVDGKNPDAYVDEAAYEKICKLLKLIIHPDIHCSMYDGLEDYAWLLITACLCTMCRPESEFYKLSGDDTGTLKIRYYQTGLLEIARKNYKTFNAAVIFILLMLTEPDFSRFFSVAPELQLSQELYIAVKKIIKSSPILFDEEDPVFKINRKEIICLINENNYIPLAYSQDKMDGKLANCFLADEVAAMDSYPVSAMRTSQRTLLSKLGLIISTQYPNYDNGFSVELNIAKSVLDGTSKKRYFALIYEPDDDLKQGDIWQTDDRCIYQANPVSVHNRIHFQSIVDDRETAVLYENYRQDFLCKALNLLYRSLGTEQYIDPQKVKLCAADIPKEWWRGKRVYLGLDLSQTNDNTAVCMVTEEDDITYAQTFGFIPKDRMMIKSKKEGVDYREFIKAGECFACGDEVISYGFVEDFIIHTLQEDYGVEIVQVGYDRYNAISTVQKLEEAGIECVEIKQHSSVLHMPTKWLKEAVLGRLFKYAASTLLEINFQNARIKYDTNLNLFVAKKFSDGKVDLVIGLINAMYLLQQEKLNGNDFVVQC